MYSGPAKFRRTESGAGPTCTYVQPGRGMGGFRFLLPSGPCGRIAGENTYWRPLEFRRTALEGCVNFIYAQPCRRAEGFQNRLPLGEGGIGDRGRYIVAPGSGPYSVGQMRQLYLLFAHHMLRDFRFPLRLGAQVAR